MPMNSLEYQNMLVDHRRNVLNLIRREQMGPNNRMRLIYYAQDLTKVIDDLNKRILIQFEYDENLSTYNDSRSHQEPDCLTVGNFKSAKLGDY